MKLRPSSLPMLAKCALFDSGNSGDESQYASAGTMRHALLKCFLSADTFDGIPIPNELNEEDIDACKWATEYIRVHAPMSDYAIDFERKLTLIDLSRFEEILSGTPDVVCGRHLFDLKWRYRDYSAQMAAYALMMFDAGIVGDVCVHVLFGESKRAEVFTLTKEAAAEIVFGIIAKTEDKAAEPSANEYCGWCSKRLTCAAFTDRALEVANNRPDWKLENYHTSEINSPEQMSKCLRLARHLKKWIDAAEYHAEKMAASGVALPGFELRERKGRTFCTNVAQAFALAGVPQEKFLQCCELRINSSTTYKDKVGITEIYAEQTGQKKATAKRDLLAKLAPVLTTGNSTKSLVACNETEALAE